MEATLFRYIKLSFMLLTQAGSKDLRQFYIDRAVYWECASKNPVFA